MKTLIVKLIRIFLFLIMICLISVSEAQVIYTDLIPDSVIVTNDSIYRLDLNNDGIVDFNLKFLTSTVTGVGCTGTKTRHGVTVSPVDTLLDMVANRSYAGTNYPPPIAADTMIDDTNYVWNHKLNQYLVYVNWTCRTGKHNTHTWVSTTTGKWNGATDKFLGLRFIAGGNTYYGWVRLTVGTSSFTVKDYAYNSSPGKLIFAGQSTTEYLTTSSILNSPFCLSDTVSVGYTVYGNFDSTNVFTAQLSDSSGSFSNPVAIGSINSNLSGVVIATIPPGTHYGLLYRIRIVASSPVGVANSNGTNLIINSSVPSNHITTSDPTTICLGLYVGMYAPYEQGNSYQWTINDSAIVSASSYYLDGNDEGVYRCIITNGCGSVLSDSIIVTFGPAPPVSIATTGSLWICPGQSVLFTASLVPGYSYSWLRNGNFITNEEQPTYIAIQSGRYSVMITDSLGCANYSSEDTLNISSPLANIIAGGPTIFCNGDSVTLSQSAVSDSSFTFQWYRDNNIIPGANTQIYSANLTGNYTITVTNPSGNCSSVSNTINVTASCTGLELINDKYFSISPNPASQFLIIERQSRNTAYIQIFNHLGQTFYLGKINSAGVVVDVSNFSEGIYFLKYIEGEFSECKKFTVVR